jgi:hypothetical protein
MSGSPGRHSGRPGRSGHGFEPRIADFPGSSRSLLDSRPHIAIISGGGERGCECHRPVPRILLRQNWTRARNAIILRRTIATESYFEQAGGSGEVVYVNATAFGLLRSLSGG